EGLTSAIQAGEGMDRSALEGLLNNLSQRVFLMRNVHEDAPVLFQTRWALSYLRGPLTGPEIARAMAGRKSAAPAAPAAAAPAAQLAVASSSRPAVGVGITEYFLPATKGSGPATYRLMIAGFAKLHYVDAKLSLDEWETGGWLAPLDDAGAPSWVDAAHDANLKSRLTAAPQPEAEFAELPAATLRAAS